MITQMYTIYDTCAKVHNKPFHQVNEETALRTFKDLANDPAGEISKHPEHYQLFHHGEYDDTTGHIVAHEAIHVANAKDLVL